MSSLASDCVNFVVNYKKEAHKLSKLLTDDSYDHYVKRFRRIVEEYEKCVRSSHSSDNSDLHKSREDEETNNKPTTSKNADKKLDKDAMFVRKFFTPLLHKVEEPVFKNDQNATSSQSSIKSKKRSALAAEISVLVEEERGGAESDDSSDDDRKTAKQLFSDKPNCNEVEMEETEVKNNHKKTLGENEASENDEADVKKKKNPPKKLKLTPETKVAQSEVEEKVDEEEEEGEKPKGKGKTKKGGKKKKKVTVKSRKTKVESNEEKMNETCRDPEQPETVKVEVIVDDEVEAENDQEKKKTKKLTKNKKVKSKIVSSEKVEKKPDNEVVVVASSAATKTPSRLVLKPALKTPMSRLSSTIQRTIKKRPMTRRAAAAAAALATQATTTSNEQTTTTTTNNNQVKKLINKFESSTKTPGGGGGGSRIIAAAQNTLNKYKTFRTSIDNRKLRHSQVKLSSKCVKQAAKALLKLDSDEKSVLEVEETRIVEVDAGLEGTKCEIVENGETRQIKINTHTPQEREIVNSIFKSGSPKLVVSKIPVSLIPTAVNPTVSALRATSIVAEQQQKKVKIENLAANQSIVQNYRLLQTVTKSTPSKSIFTTQQQQQQQQQNSRTSFNKFLERNTPSKLTKFEIDERRKAELNAKEAKEKERLDTLLKQKEEKREETRKKMLEKMEKANAKRLELEQKLAEKEKKEKQPILPKPQSTTNLTSALNPNRTLTATFSANSISTNLKKPVIVLNQLNTSNLQTNPQQQLSNKTKKLSTQEISEVVNGLKAFREQSMAMPNYLKEKSANLPPAKNTLILSNETKLKNLETTYVLTSPATNKPKADFKSSFANYECTPLQPLKLKDPDNYDVSNLKSDDGTDDDEEPSKPIPEWAKEANLTGKVKIQALRAFNFTKLFKKSSSTEIILEKIFKTRRKKFTQRSSSANWDSSPVWRTQGLNGEESFRHFRKYY